jgi:transcription elongation GreA/GreB family factor
LATGEEKLIELTDYWEADPTKNKVYYNSPLGIALTKKKIKEISEVQTQHGNYKVQIIDIK